MTPAAWIGLAAAFAGLVLWIAAGRRPLARTGGLTLVLVGYVAFFIAVVPAVQRGSLGDGARTAVLAGAIALFWLMTRYEQNRG